jgi:UDP-N-acetylmuramyl pentapeptide phosphotransferase/UDP-N-acetylglucosamine-1-phosphate transferase
VTGILALVVAGWIGTGILAALAARAGLVDRSESAPERKLQPSPVPRVGGILLALAWIAFSPTHLWPLSCLPALAAAFATGLADDLAPRGLPRALKFGLEAGTCALFAWQAPGSPVLGFALAALALSAANTFDNADGALGTLGCAGLALSAPWAAALLGGFLPWNLWIRTRSGAPSAYLGDAGSHVIGLLLASDARSAPFLALPAFDLVRLALVRWRAGSRPWIGDRRHLAHRLQARGLGPTAVALALLAIASPACFLSPAWAAGATLVLFCAALLLTPDPCPGPARAG